MHRRALLKGMAAGLSMCCMCAASDASAADRDSHEVMAVGWYVIFSRPSTMAEMTAFYAQTLGLPLMLSMRGPQNKDLFWGGEDIDIDVSHHALELPLDPREADPDAARQIPFFRTDDLAALLATLSARGAKVFAPRAAAHGREAFVVDPMGRLIGFRQRDARSPFAPDREAHRRLTRGEAFNPGVAPMPPHVQELGWVRISVADPAAARRFYGGLLGLRSLGSSHGVDSFDLGDNTTLEIAPGGRPRAPPTEQRAAESVIILRVVSFARMRARLEATGLRFPYKIYDKANGSFSYIADSEGNLIGLADRKPPASYSSTQPVAVEDLEAQRRWVEASAREAH
jgi:predicted enzyme related to lactoylglutathione lyase